MELTTAEIRIGGDLRNVMVRGALNPVTVPELEVLKLVHGDDAVKQLESCGWVERTSKAEKRRLAEKYGGDIVELAYPGINGNGMEMGEKPKPKRPSRAKKKATVSEPQKDEAQQELL